MTFVSDTQPALLEDLPAAHRRVPSGAGEGPASAGNGQAADQEGVNLGRAGDRMGAEARAGGQHLPGHSPRPAATPAGVRLYVLAVTDRFRFHRPPDVWRARALLDQLDSAYERSYYARIIDERHEGRTIGAVDR